MIIYYPPIVSASVTFMLIMILNKGGALQDIPSERSLHSKPIPRTGGIALMAGILSAWFFLDHLWKWWIILPVMGLFVLSLLDDLHNLTPKTRLIGHSIAALIALSGAGVPWLWFIPLLLFIVWMTNLYNFMDGSDGLAGGMTLFGFSSYGVGAWLSGNEAFAMLNLSVASAALCFLVFNFHPAKVFMGDSGSIPLGFLAAMFGVSGWQLGCWPFWFPILVFSPFVADSTVTLLMRSLHGEKITQAHRSHYYQRLVLMGWGHRNTAIAEYVLMFIVSTSALYGTGVEFRSQGYLLIFWCAIYFLMMKWVDRCWRQHVAHKENITAG